MKARNDMNISSFRVCASLLGAVLVWLTSAAWAQSSSAESYPTRPGRLIVAYPPGGGADILARVLAQKLSESLGQSFVVDNRAGATGIIGTDAVAKAAPDGYTLLLITTDQTVVSSFPNKLHYDLVNDFQPVTQLTSQPYLVAAHPSVPAKSLQEFIALAKSRPGQLSFASGGNGGTPHLAGEQFKSLAGINMLHVPYKGGGPALLAVVSGEVSIAFVSLPSTLPLAQAGKVKVLAVSGAKRIPALADIPTVAESGAVGFDVTAWYGIMAPAKTPMSIINRLQRELVKAMNTADLKGRLEKDGTDIVGSTPEEFAAFIKADLDKWTKVIKASGVKFGG